MAHSINARFWMYWNHDFVKITMRQGQTIHLHTSEPTEEGYHFDERFFDFDGYHVFQEYHYGGRDCDGVTTYTGERTATLETLGDTHPDFFGYPEWEEGRCEVYDQFARMMNY